VYRGDDGGIWKSTNGGDTFVPLNNTTFRATQFQSLALHPIDPDFTIGGTQDNGTERLTTGPVWIHSDDGDGGFTEIDQNAVNNTNVTMYHTYFNQAGTQIGYARSTPLVGVRVRGAFWVAVVPAQPEELAVPTRSTSTPQWRLVRELRPESIWERTVSIVQPTPATATRS
jgi:hypothetical protein